MILATIDTPNGKIELDRETGMWEGQPKATRLANAIATLKMATPDKGDPVRWVVQQVARVIPGRVETPYLDDYKSDANDGRVY